MITSYEETNENLYEIFLGVRDKLFAEIINTENTEIIEGITKFLEMENEHLFKAETVRLLEPDQKTLSLSKFYTGRVDITKTGYAVEGYIDEILDRVDYIGKIVGEGFDTVAELGGGWGLNLFLLSKLIGKSGPRLILAKYTETGRKLCEKFEGLRGAPKLQKVFVDHRNLDLSFINETRKLLIFTCHSVEQIDHIPKDYFQKICAAADEVVGLHLEPVGFQLMPDDDVRKKCRENFTREKRYNLNFFETIKAAETSNILTIRNIEIERFASQPENPTSIIVWDKC